ncbi:DUF202 domain-containing protein [Streptosporangium carneum]|uniref:DUF202 domain-containing protein n=1 Tax=Streptosporangium carneum TaxID=47481 RepID=A0A9W6MG76_9ACTN|nr:DUF202 domain-containing protein [Streptosporangium carneum]GLK12852.1 hypothetical protein GCM10017600_62620 [Streptosporangium carneum]
MIPIWDEGLQNERTRLAWVRTAAVMAVGGLGAGGVVLRAGVSPVAVIPFALASASGALLLARTGVRYRHVQRALHEGDPLDDRADAVIAWLGTIAVVLGAAAFVLIR